MLVKLLEVLNCSRIATAHTHDNLPCCHIIAVAIFSILIFSEQTIQDLVFGASPSVAATLLTFPLLFFVFLFFFQWFGCKRCDGVRLVNLKLVSFEFQVTSMIGRQIR